jgi:hypothetical protein
LHALVPLQVDCLKWNLSFCPGISSPENN